MENNLIAILTTIITAVNTLGILYIALQKYKPEVKKLEAESEKTEAEVDSEIVAAANVNLAGAEVSTRMLLQRLQELKEDLENEKKARRDDAEYFRRRFREAERDARDYRQWAARLAKQVIEAGKVPVAFVPSTEGDSEKLRAVSDDDLKRDEKEARIEQERNGK
jgi:uncharacterized membrane protein YgaE (UPF0421/DUF939 family)